MLSLASLPIILNSSDEVKLHLDVPKKLFDEAIKVFKTYGDLTIAPLAFLGLFAASFSICLWRTRILKNRAAKSA